jgi:DNA-binding IclR family transcriptional regulator
MRKAHTGKVRPKCATAVGRVWVTTLDRTEEIYLKPGEEAPEGWVKGRKKFAPRNEESKQKTREALTGKPKTKEHIENIRKARLDFIARTR